MTFQHTSVLFEESITYMNPKPGEIFIDGTLGGAGHATAFLERLLPGGRLIGLDQDMTALENAKIKLADYKDHVTLIHRNFNQLKDVLAELNIEEVDGIFLDIGVSSPQIDTPERGFSYMHDARLDMRMDQDAEPDAYEVINHYREEDLHRIIKKYGEEKWAKRVAAFIAEKRKESPIETTFDLVRVIEAAIPKGAREKGSHPAKRTFQAIRIEVNKELQVLEQVIDDAISVLRKGGRLGIITFHSLEDRIVKEKFNYYQKECICPEELPMCQCTKKREVKVLTKKPLGPTEEEIETNKRAKSAKLRVAQKL